MGASLANHRTGDGRRAARTGQTRTTKHVERVGMSAASSGHAVKVGLARPQRRSAVLDRPSQHRPDGGV